LRGPPAWIEARLQERIVAGFQTEWSTPFRIPESTALRCAMTASRPQPNSGVWISRAYVGLTVVDVIGVLQAGLDCRSLAVKFQTVEDEAGLGQQQRRQQILREQP